MKKLISLIAILLLLTLVFASCVDEGKEPIAQTEEQTPEAPVEFGGTDFESLDSCGLRPAYYHYIVTSSSFEEFITEFPATEKVFFGALTAPEVAALSQYIKLSGVSPKAIKYAKSMYERTDKDVVYGSDWDKLDEEDIYIENEGDFTFYWYDGEKEYCLLSIECSDRSRDLPSGEKYAQYEGYNNIRKYIGEINSAFTAIYYIKLNDKTVAELCFYNNYENQADVEASIEICNVIKSYMEN